MFSYCTVRSHHSCIAWLDQRKGTLSLVGGRPRDIASISGKVHPCKGVPSKAKTLQYQSIIQSHATPCCESEIYLVSHLPISAYLCLSVYLSV